jgi:pantoate--beta-alanine ligase
MHIATTIVDLQQRVAAERAQGRRIAFVPTLGNLHAGHHYLMGEARRHGDLVVASIFVNPLQFGPQEDFSAYPRTPEEDKRLLASAAVDVLFMPDEGQMYPRGRSAQTVVEVPGVGDILCGQHRPGHFRGVTTVVNRLLNLVAPDVALFGNKDYQQLLLIRLMTSDLGMPVSIVGVDTVRETDGLALSSRNAYLTEEERTRAPRLYAALVALGGQIQQAQGVPVGAEAAAQADLAEAGFRPDYVSVRRQAAAKITSFRSPPGLAGPVLSTISPWI